LPEIERVQRPSCGQAIKNAYAFAPTPQALTKIDELLECMRDRENATELELEQYRRFSREYNQ